VRNVLVVDSTVEHTLAAKIKGRAPDKKVLIRGENFDLKKFDHPDELTVMAWIKPINLHQSPELLREAVIKVIHKIEPYVRSVLLFYGQCGNAFLNMDLLAEKTRVPLTILRDKDGSLIDDCYGTVLGGREEYRLFLVNTDGPVYVLNSMWAANWRRFMQEVQMLHDPNDVEEVRQIFRYMEYKKVVGLNTGLVEESIFDMQLEEFSDIFGLPQENRRCTLRLVEESYREAKRLMGPTDGEKDGTAGPGTEPARPEWSGV
ncbi:MAG TPA: DUF1638 domain-containing protein, partial [Methanomassiliicoccales archaeon]|nr:DUF1638 domain-containing protein [Methanomassiliicoccales archaeon]